MENISAKSSCHLQRPLLKKITPLNSLSCWKKKALPSLNIWSKTKTALQSKAYIKASALPDKLWLHRRPSQTKNLQPNGKMSPGRDSPLQQMLHNTTQQMEKLCVLNQK